MIEYDPRSVDDLNRLDRPIRREIADYLEHRVAPSGDPRQFGEGIAA
jgi:hypothetical protein